MCGLRPCEAKQGTAMQKAIAYYRVSTEHQGRSGLGLEAQQKAVNDFAKANDFMVIDQFIEIHSAKRKHRYGLIAALRECKSEHAILIIAQLDRLSRSVAFISTLMESGADFKVVDNPYAERFTLHILAAVAEKERADISKRTTVALAAAKLRGVELGKYGRHVLSKLNKRHADQFAESMRPLLDTLKECGITTLRAITQELNKRNVPTFKKEGHKWHVTTVYNLLKRLSGK